MARHQHPARLSPTTRAALTSFVALDVLLARDAVDEARKLVQQSADLSDEARLVALEAALNGFLDAMRPLLGLDAGSISRAPSVHLPPICSTLLGPC